MKIRILQIILILGLIWPFTIHASERSDGEDFNLVEFALHHIADSYSWVFYEKDDGTAVELQLPRIFLHKETKKLKFFISTTQAEKNGFIQEHEFNEEASHGFMLVPEAKENLEPLKLQIEHESDPELKTKLKEELADKLSSFRPIDFSISKNVLFMLFASFFLIWIFISIANKYKKNPASAPSGLQSALEPIIVFIRDDIAKTYIPHNYERFLPLLLNFFFFIWFLNMMGLVPFSGNVTGNFSVTFALALITALATNINAKGSYWKHIFWFPGVPIFVKPIMLIVEFVSVFTKPFALMIRLFANITAGHLVILAFISMIFLFGKLGAAPGAGYISSVASIAFALFINCIELLIALLQAYIFTTLSALFIGQAVETEH